MNFSIHAKCVRIADYACVPSESRRNTRLRTWLDRVDGVGPSPYRTAKFIPTDGYEATSHIPHYGFACLGTMDIGRHKFRSHAWPAPQPLLRRQVCPGSTANTVQRAGSEGC